MCTHTLERKQMIGVLEVGTQDQEKLPLPGFDGDQLDSTPDS